MKVFFFVAVLLLDSAFVSSAQNMSIVVNNNYLLMDANTMNYLSQKSQEHTTATYRTNIKLHIQRGTILNTTYDTTVRYFVGPSGMTAAELVKKFSIYNAAKNISIKETSTKKAHNDISPVDTGIIYTSFLAHLPIPVYDVNPVYTITKQ